MLVLRLRRRFESHLSSVIDGRCRGTLKEPGTCHCVMLHFTNAENDQVKFMPLSGEGKNIHLLQS